MNTKFYECQKSTQPFPHSDIHHEDHRTHRFVWMHGASFIPDEEDNKRITESRWCAEIQCWLRKEQCKYFFSMRRFSVWPVKVLIQTVTMTLIRSTSPVQVEVSISTAYLWAPDSELWPGEWLYWTRASQTLVVYWADTTWFRDTYCLHPPLTLRRLMSYIYGAPILDVSRSHTTTQHSR